jgi:hypothetical protein
MQNDDILWRKVEGLKNQEAKKSRPSPPAPEHPVEEITASIKLPRQQARNRASKHDGMSSNNQHDERASTQASVLACYPLEWIDAVRKVVKGTGKEIAFARLTSQEKQRLTDVVYGFRRQGIKTSENEVLRIAINHILEDFEACGDQSILQRVIGALRA